MQIRILVLAGLAGVVAEACLFATDPPPPQITLTSSNAQKKVTWTPYPAAQQYNILSVSNLGAFFSNDLSGGISGNTWTGSNAGPRRFYELAVTPMSSNALLTANVLNRLAYGPTPDELERVAAIGPQAYIDEQLNIQGVAETLDAYTVVQTNAVNGGQAIPNTNWVSITVTGRYSSPVLYIYMTTPGQVFIDDLQLRPIYFTNIVTMVGTNMVTNSFPAYGTNLVVNGDFETPLTNIWYISPNLAGSGINFTNVCGGTGSLHVVSLSPGTTQGSSIYQTNVTTLPSTIISNNQPVQLSYKYLPGPGTDRLKIRLSGSGVVSSADDLPPVPSWVYATATGTATSSNLYIYLTGIPAGTTGRIYIDDIKLVAGSVAESGANLVRNGGFESPLLPTDWYPASNMLASVISSTVSHSGAGSLYVQASVSGSTFSSALVQSNIAGMTLNATYTLSYWYSPGVYPVTVRLSGSGINSVPDTTVPGLYRRLNTFSGAGLSDLRAWFCHHAVEANRQLLEVLCQFWENHFVTQYSKSVEYLNVFTQDGGLQDRYAADWEYREQTKWRNAMLNPQCTFYDLLKVSAESPAMIVYLDTVNSKGNGNNIANENYARELLELFTFGVDNGYDQTDIVSSSRAWTGWSVELVDPENLNNPFASQSVTLNPNVGSTALSNTVGVLAFNYKSANHGTNRAPVFLGKTVPARFGPPWAGRSYELDFPATGRATGATNGIQDGYDVIRHLANQPFTEEYISIKLCRLLVHDDFPNPTTRTDLTNDYAFYNYNDPSRSAEAELVHQCMLAWENGNPKGQIRDVLRVIFNSDLFRSSSGSMQKVKTPLEYVASSVRALRSTNVDGTTTAGTDGYSFSTPLSRMGAMQLFNRAEPNGYPEAGPPWISAGTLAERIRYIQALLGSGVNDDAGNNVCNPVALLPKKVTAANLKNAGVVADYILSLLYPGEGKANLDLYRTAAIHYLDDGSVDPVANNTSNLLFSQLTVSNASTSSYDIRVRGMVSMLMTFQRFHEQ